MAQKLLLTLFMFLLPLLFPAFFSTDTDVSLRFTRWDIEPYLQIAADGYTAGSGNCAFYPLWPLCIRLTSWFVGGDMVLSAWLTANTFSLLAFLLFHRLVLECHGMRIANRASVLLLFYPGSIFFFVPYSESLFLLLLMVCLFSLHRGCLWSVVASSFLLPMTRAIGIFILPVLAWELIAKRGELKRCWICLAPVLGYVCYFAILYVYTGNPFEGFTIQLAYPAQPSLSRIFDFIGFINALMDFNSSHDALHSFVDRAVFVGFVVSLYFVLRVDTTYYVYSLLAGLLPAMSNIFMSYTRFAAVVFPIFIVWGQLARAPRTFLFFVLLFYGLQILFLLLFISGRWVG